MGNHHGAGANRLAIAAMSRVCHCTWRRSHPCGTVCPRPLRTRALCAAATALTRPCACVCGPPVSRDELLKLQTEFQKLAKTNADHSHTIDRAGFEKALQLVKIAESDQEILGRLFTLFDHSGDGQINFKEFIVGVSAIVRGTLEEKLQCACRLASRQANRLQPVLFPAHLCTCRRPATCSPPCVPSLHGPWHCHPFFARRCSFVLPVRHGQLGVRASARAVACA